jgi:predicted ATPase/DNA-binding CsgD family transcriptional regulator
MPFESSTLNRFPRPQASLVGRAQETAAILALLARPDVRLITLTGPGGVGKTRLALHTALTAPGFEDGRWFVELAGITEPALILPRIAQSLELQERSGSALRDQIVVALDGRTVLLVLDNFEHLLDGAVVLSQLLAQASGLTIMTTSRSPLNLANEQLVSIGPLELAGTRNGVAHSEAVELFLQRSRAIRPTYEPTPADLRAIEAICLELSGVPLAIELASARTRVMSPQALLTHLSRPLHLLAAGPTDAPVRHRSMRDAIDWSYRLLSSEQRAMLRAMGVFAGSVPLDGIESVAAAAGIAGEFSTIELIEQLVDASMIESLETGDGDPRFLLYAPVREFVVLEMEPTGERATLRGHHARWVDELTREYETLMFGPREHVSHARMRADLDNIRAALAWSLERDEIGQSARIAGNLWGFWSFSAQGSEGQRWIDRILPRLSSASLQPADEWQFFHSAGMVAWSRGDATLATERHRQALAVADSIPDPKRQAVSLMWLSQSAWYLGDYEQMAEFARATLTFADAAPTYAAGAYDLLGIAAMRLDRLDVAERELDRALQEQTRYAQVRGIIWTYQLQADLAQQRGDLPSAARAHRKSLPLALESENHWAMFESVSGLITIALKMDWAREALELLASAELMLTSYAVLPREGTWLSETERAQIKASLRPDDLQRLADRAAGLSLRQMVDRAVEIAGSMERGEVREHENSAEALEPITTVDFSLTRREQEVLGLMVQGMSDRQIGDTLFISHRTARTHVSHVLQKLDARNRAAAVRKALEHELV